MRPDWRCALLLTGLLPLQLAARDLDYGTITEPAVQRCDRLFWSGQAAARSCYQTLQQAASPAVRAEGAWALGDLKTANDLFRAAVAADPASAALRVRWGELYIDSHQDQDALDLFREAQQRDAHNAYARVDTALVLADEFASQAGESLQIALEDPQAPSGARLKALLLAVRMALEDNDLARAGTLLERADALAGTPPQTLPLQQLDALHAGLELLAGRDYQPWIDKALAIDPSYGEAYATPAHFYVMTRRQREAIVLYQQAVAIEPQLWSAQVELASCLLRENRISEARTHLQQAYRGDPFNPVTGNTLKLLDSLDQFDSVSDPAGSDTPTLLLRLDKKESAVLAPYALALAERAMASYAQRYQYRLRAPVVVEIYPNHEDFAVRTAGVPGIGLLGVTFGYVVAMDSPSSRAVNEFHWGTTLWHELAHVFTLESTEHRVPRWLSEGLSVFEEWRTGPIAGMEIPPYAFAALAQGKALPVTAMDRGFVRAAYPMQLQVSYMQAGLICDFIDRRFGFDHLLALLHAYEHTTDTAEALQSALGVSAAQFDQQFQADLQRQFGTLFAQVDVWQAARAAALTAAEHQNWLEAQRQAQRALALMPQDVDDGSPYLPLAQAYAHTQQDAALLTALRDYWHRGGHDPQALRELGERLQRAGQHDDAIAVLQAINYVAPFDDAVHGELGEWLLAAQRPAEALTEFRVALALQPPDLAAAHLHLAQAHYALQALPEARREVLAALELAPNYAPAQQLLLQLVPSPSASATAH